jgi:hypothetical protein
VTLKKRLAEAKPSSLNDRAISTAQKLRELKLAHRPESFWYPYSTLRNVGILEQLSAKAGLDFLQLCGGQHGKVADIGAADGDLAFFLENEGLSVDVIDNEETNFNGLKGAWILKETLKSSVTIRSVDLDSQFSLPGEEYDAMFLLGTLYHLKNPFFVLEKLSQMTRYCFVSTRIAQQTVDGRPLSGYPVAYLLAPDECNDDYTNIWIFSDEGLKRLIDRTGWSVLSQLRVGDTTNSTPADPDRDERAFCLLQRIEPTLSVSSNPSSPGEKLRKATISWSGGKVYVSMNEGEESLFGVRPQGSKVAHWIQPDSTYEFRLYNLGHTKLLAQVTVPQAAQ